MRRHFDIVRACACKATGLATSKWDVTAKAKSRTSMFYEVEALSGAFPICSPRVGHQAISRFATQCIAETDRSSGAQAHISIETERGLLVCLQTHVWDGAGELPR